MAALACAALIASPMLAASAKTSIAVGDTALISEGSWQPVLAQGIKTSAHKGLGIHVSLECGLYTSTKVKTKGLAKGDAYASVQVRVLVDGAEVAAPGPVTFCSRGQSLSALYQGIFTKLEDGGTCLYLEDVDTDGDMIPDDTIVKFDESCLTPEEVALLDDSMGAHSFFFYYDDTLPGDHSIVVEALIDENVGAEGASTSVGDQGAKATLGKGSLSIEEVRLVNGASGESIDF
jgi:hypothetical protein